MIPFANTPKQQPQQQLVVIKSFHWLHTHFVCTLGSWMNVFELCEDRGAAVNNINK